MGDDQAWLDALPEAARIALVEAVRRVVQAAQPIRVVLFGSAARCDLGPDSDLDLLVVVEGPVHRRHLAQRIHGTFFGLGVPIDVVVVTAQDLEGMANQKGTVLASALSEGRQVYAARTS
jgi:predicted nucleotidyltransferase